MKSLVLVNLLNNERHEIICSLDDNAVIVKRTLSKQIEIDERLIQLFIDRQIILNNNEFIPKDQNIIFFEIVDKLIDEVILQIRKNHFGIPKCIQVNRNSTIKDVKNILSRYCQNNLSTFLFHENGEMLMDDKTVDSYALTNASKIKVWRGPTLLVTLNICNPFIKVNDSQQTQMIQPMQFSMTDSIVEVKRTISNILDTNQKLNLALFTDSSYLQDGKLLIDYPFCNERSNIFYVNLKNHEEVNIGSRISRGKYAKIFNGEFGFPSQEVAVNRYKMNNNSINDKKILKYEIVTRIKMSNAKIKRFVQLISMYEDEKYFYIVTDYMKGGSLKSRYLASPLQEREIVRYSIQICEALDYMHDNYFIHRNLTCSSVLIDDNDNIKLSNFHLSKYLFSNTIKQILDGIPGSRIDTKRCWLAPEVLRNDPYGLKSDIWSFGITMMEMLTRNRPYPNMNVVLATHRIVTEKTIQYDRNISPNLSGIIDQCIHSLQWERPTAKQCIQLLNTIPY